eukprot:COSAG02_NODE_22452_length_752_cov_1.098009_1_plen_240_part_10
MQSVHVSLLVTRSSSGQLAPPPLAGETGNKLYCWLQAHCPEEMDACKADGSCPRGYFSASVKEALTQIKDDVRDVPGLVDVRECVLDRATVDCVGEWSPCSASCKKTYKVLLERDEYGFGEACEHADGEAGTCPANEDTGCHEVLEESVYGVYKAGVNFFDPVEDGGIPSKEWPDCKKGLSQQRFTYWEDIKPSQCLFDDGCCEDGTPCNIGAVEYRDCPRPCKGEWSPCDPTLGQRQQR